jgi:ParB family chromosome partitioning protein
MARKNPFANLMDSPEVPASEDVALNYTIKGASRSFISSIDEMAARADSVLQGETVVELDPETVDISFVRDRIGADEDDFRDLLEAIRDRGQDSPILVRPHPGQSGRYMVVFGHRRLRAAKELKRKVRAIIREIKDRDHVVAQGQENSARENLTFIERARYAAALVGLGFDEDNSTVMAALSIDRTTLSKMLSVAGLPETILNFMGAAKGVGRDRWYELKQLLDNPVLLSTALDYVGQSQSTSLQGPDAFNALITHLKAAKSRKRSKPKPVKRSWAPADGTLSADIISEGKRYSLALKAKGADAGSFGDYLSEHLDELYEAFRQQAMHKQ